MPKLGRTAASLDQLLTWIDRIQYWSPIGKLVIASTSSILFGCWAAMKGQPPYILVPIMFGIFASILVMFAQVGPALARMHPFPFVISVPGMLRDVHTIQLHTLILNRQSNHRVVLTIALHLNQADGSTLVLRQATIGLTLCLGPEEITEGLITFANQPFEMPQYETASLVITDAISNRTARFSVPGHYPRGAFLMSSAAPTFETVGSKVRRDEQ